MLGTAHRSKFGDEVREAHLDAAIFRIEPVDHGGMAPKFVASIGRSCSFSNCTKRDMCVPFTSSEVHIHACRGDRVLQRRTLADTNRMMDVLVPTRLIGMRRVSARPCTSSIVMLAVSGREVMVMLVVFVVESPLRWVSVRRAHVQR